MPDVDPLSTDASSEAPRAGARAPRRRKSRSSIDNHLDRARIERDLAIGRPLGKLAKKYGVGKHSLWRHKQKLPPQLKAALAAHALAPTEDLEKLRLDESEGLLSNLAAQRARLLLAQDAALEAEQFSIVAQLAGGIHRNIELTGKLVGEFAQHTVTTTISILVSEEYLKLRTALVQALMPFPDARRTVAEVLHRIEGQAAQRPAARVLTAIAQKPEAAEHAVAS